MTGFSQSRSFIGGAISTAASPLRNNFELNCRSPVTPRRPRPSGHDDNHRGLYVNTEQSRYGAYSNSPYVSTPRSIPIASPTKRQSVYHTRHNEDAISSSTTLVSATLSSQFLPSTPHYTPPPTGKLGTFSAINIILGKTVGVGIYSIPSSIFLSVGSIGASLTLWILGSLISFCGLAVYLDLGTTIPRSGGERVYLERIFRKPRMLATCMFMSYVVFLGFSTPNCIVLGEYVMYALDVEANRWNVRTVAVAVITLLCIIHARYQDFGLRIINVLGVGKMLILVVVIISGIAGALMGVGSTASSSSIARRRLMDGTWSIDAQFLSRENEDGVAGLSTAQRNFSNIWAGSSTQPYDYATALLKILYCFRGYSTANQVLSEIRNPIPTLEIAAPIALSLVSAGYVLANVAYFLVVEKEDFRTAGVVVAGHFFKNIFGQVMGENILPLFIIISAFGNIAATSFAQARVNQELGRDGLLPFSKFFSGHSRRHSRKESDAESDEDEKPPIPGLFLHWLVSVLVIVVPPPGEIYNFLVDIGGYPVSVISVAISLGLLYLQMKPKENWQSPFKARKVYILVFALSNCLLLVLPWVKPRDEREGKEEGKFRYYAYPATALAILASGVVYWVWWAKVKSMFSVDRRDLAWERETVPMMRLGKYGSNDGEEETMGIMAEDGEDEAGSREHELEERDAVRKRAPCGCPVDHGVKNA